MDPEEPHTVMDSVEIRETEGGGMEFHATFARRGLSPDVEWLRDALGHFILDGETDDPQEKLRSANAKFREALEDGGVSPFVAFKQVISTTALAQEMDARYATQGGLDFYISSNHFSGYHPSDALKAEMNEAANRRKMEEIKKLMANNK